VETITLILFLLLSVVISGTLVRMSPVPLPLPLVQIALGALIAWVANFGVALQPDVFFLLFLPPLLFLDGWRVPREGLIHDKGTILALALGLVVATVVGVGFFIHAMVPSMAALVRRIDEIERELRLAGLRAERAEIYRIGRSRRLPDDLIRRLVREVDLLEARFT
jgi:hypothetical protein